MNRIHSTGYLLRAPVLSIVLGLAGSVAANAVVLVNESGMVTGIDALQITGGGLDSVYDIRFTVEGLADAIANAPEQLTIYENPAYDGVVAAEAVALSISQALQAGGHGLLDNGFGGEYYFSVPYAFVPASSPEVSLFYYAYDENHDTPQPPNWVLGGTQDQLHTFRGAIVLMQASNPSPSVPEPETFAWVSGVMLAGFAFWRHRRTS
jgi:hypothetical protein